MMLIEFKFELISELKLYRSPNLRSKSPHIKSELQWNLAQIEKIAITIISIECHINKNSYVLKKL